MSDRSHVISTSSSSNRVVDGKTGYVLTAVDFPLGYVHGVNDVLSSQVMAELEANRSVKRFLLNWTATSCSVPGTSL